MHWCIILNWWIRFSNTPNKHSLATRSTYKDRGEKKTKWRTDPRVSLISLTETTLFWISILSFCSLFCCFFYYFSPWNLLNLGITICLRELYVISASFFPLLYDFSVFFYFLHSLQLRAKLSTPFATNFLIVSMVSHSVVRICAVSILPSPSFSLISRYMHTVRLLDYITWADVEIRNQRVFDDGEIEENKGEKSP